MDTAQLPPPDPTIHPVGRDHSGKTAAQQLAVLKYCGLRDDSVMLEIGCGIGRLVYVLADHLRKGSYSGFDISVKAIEWLNQKYAPLLPNFRFDLIEARNARYRPQADQSPENVVFPYQDNSFDLSCAFSVFTHMRMPSIVHYLQELRRVMRPGSRSAMTFFAVRPQDRAPKLVDQPFAELEDGSFTTSVEVPERAIAFTDRDIRAAIDEAGFAVDDLIVGTWHGDGPPEGQPTYQQDIYILR